MVWGLIYKTSYDKYTTMLRHAECLRQMYDKTRLTKNRTTKLPRKLRQNVRQLISCRTTASSVHAVIILIFH